MPFCEKGIQKHCKEIRETKHDHEHKIQFTDEVASSQLENTI